MVRFENENQNFIMFPKLLYFFVQHQVVTKSKYAACCKTNDLFYNE